MKKILATIMSTVIIAAVAVVVVYNAQPNNNQPTTTTTNASAATKQIPTEKALIKESDAIDMIESYSDKQLGLSKEDRQKCSFMVSNYGEVIGNESYVKVIAATKKEHKDKKSGKITFTFDTKGEYFISYDGNKVMMKDSSTGKYTTIK